VTAGLLVFHRKDQIGQVLLKFLLGDLESLILELLRARVGHDQLQVLSGRILNLESRPSSPGLADRPSQLR
jgi:hypothetical protein